MALIPEIIPPQAFELIRDRIGAILKDELNRQALLTYDSLLLQTKIKTESINPEDKAGLPVLNVNFATGVYEGKDYSVGVRANPYSYFIDGYTNGKTTSSVDGDYNAAIKLHKILGKARYILEHSIYKTLGFSPPFIERVYFSDIGIKEVGANDAENSMMGRLIFNVVVNESCKPIIPQLIQGATTIINVNGTNDGYIYQV